MAEPTKGELQEQLTDMTKRATDAEARVTELTTDCEAATKRADEVATAYAERGKELDRVNGELRAATSSLKAYKGSATKARNEATVLRRELSPETRVIGAMKPPKTQEDVEARAAALEAAFAMDTSELVFSDGRREIRELAPLAITNDAWRVTPQGRVLNCEPLLEPGNCSREHLDLRGFALLNEAGEQVGWCPAPTTIVIAANTKVQIPHNSIRF